MIEACFVDTSAIYALLVANDVAHAEAARIFEKLGRGQARLVTSSHVLVECYALLGRRLGVEAVERFAADFEPILEVQWVDATVHAAARARLLRARERDLSLVDCTSFEIMRALGLISAFAFDEHFVKAGFACLRSGEL